MLLPDGRQAILITELAAVDLNDTVAITIEMDVMTEMFLVIAVTSHGAKVVIKRIEDEDAATAAYNRIIGSIRTFLSSTQYFKLIDLRE